MPHTFNLRFRLWFWLWFYHWFWFWFWFWLWLWFCLWLRGRLRGHLYFLYYLLFYNYTTCSESRGERKGSERVTEAGEMERGKRWSGECMRGGDVRYEEVHDGAVWGNCHRMVLKQVRQQAVTGGKRSVIDVQSLMDEM